MATYTERVRQGLPRTPGGAPWPIDGVAAGAPAAANPASTGIAAPAPVSAPAEAVAAGPPVAAEVTAAVPAATPAVAVSTPLRQGLPRVAGGEPWPSGGVAAAPIAPAPAESPAVADVAAADAADVAAADTVVSLASSGEKPVASNISASGTPLRQGLPRVVGGDAWPEAGFAPAWAAKRTHEMSAAGASEAVVPAPTPVVTVQTDASVAATVAPAAQPAASVAPAVPAAAVAPEPEVPKAAAPAAVSQTAAPAHITAPTQKAKSVREPVMIGEKSLGQWAKIAVLGALGAIAAAGIIVLAARGVTTLPGVPAWLERYPGEYALPEIAEPGFPVWARWAHFFNLFLMVLIIRSGFLVRTQQKPPAFWTPKKGGKKISINLWLHTSLDVLWVVNGIIFVVLLFVSGHWMRIVPTSWEVFPNAASAMLQYLTLDWPVEDGWVNYNSLQQIMYFLVVFVASPVAIITGVRMSEWWPEKATTLNKLYPAPLARAIHFPTMLFFVLFILVHVFLVFTTGALKNLNHMFVGTPVVSWTGFWLFALSIAITIGGWFACKPLVLAPIANLFGKVSNR